jgi:hypothetical protein
VSGADEEYHSFWADTEAEQAKIATQFAQFISTFPRIPVLHYGTYDTKALKQMATELAHEDKQLMDRAIASCRNVLSVFHSHCYFPLYSNRLKDVAGFLGFQFDSPVRSGLDSIIFREQWERSGDSALKQALLTYNLEDCRALKTLSDFIRRSVELASARERIPGRNQEVALSASLRQAGEGNRPKYGRAEFALPEFDLANRCAYFDYQRDHVSVRKEKKPGQRRRKPRRSHSRCRSPGMNVVVGCKVCPECGSNRLRVDKVLRRDLVDLKYFKTGIGVKKWQPRYLIRQSSCRCCGATAIPASVLFNAQSQCLYGHGLVCWCVYHNVAGKQSMLQVHRSLGDIFGLRIPQKQLYRFRAALASYYEPLYQEILRAILNESVVHIDETPVKLRKTAGYVWVLATVDKVYLLYRSLERVTFSKTF